MAVGLIGSALAALAKGIFALKWWQLLLSFVAVLLIIKQGFSTELEFSYQSRGLRQSGYCQCRSICRRRSSCIHKRFSTRKPLDILQGRPVKADAKPTSDLCCWRSNMAMAHLFRLVVLHSCTISGIQSRRNHISEDRRGRCLWTQSRRRLFPYGPRASESRLRSFALGRTEDIYRIRLPILRQDHRQGQQMVHYAQRAKSGAAVHLLVNDVC